MNNVVTAVFGNTRETRTAESLPAADGPVWESIVDNNTWAPGVYGWQEVE